MILSFTSTLTSSDWDPTLSAWRCNLMRIPGFEVDAIFVEGKELTSSQYRISISQRLIYWKGSQDPPEELRVIINLTKNLTDAQLTAKWRKAAIILPILATLFAALISKMPWQNNNKLNEEIIRSLFRSELNDFSLNSRSQTANVIPYDLSKYSQLWDELDKEFRAYNAPWKVERYVKEDVVLRVHKNRYYEKKSSSEISLFYQGKL